MSGINRHSVAKALGALNAGLITLDETVQHLAELLPPSQQDQFLIVAGAPRRSVTEAAREESNAAWLRRMVAENGHCSQ